MAAAKFKYASEKQRLECAVRKLKNKESPNSFYYYPLVIDGCCPNSPITFPEIFMSFEYIGERSKEKYPYIHCSVFMRNGLSVLENFLNKGEEHPRIDCLLSFLQESEKHSKCLQKLREHPVEVEEDPSTVGLAVHLFSQLIPNNDYILDSNMFAKYDNYQCPCGCGTSVEDKVTKSETNVNEKAPKEESSKSTCLGHNEVWHGRTDILLESQFAIPTTVTTNKELAGRLCETSLSEGGSSKPSNSESIPVEIESRTEDILYNDNVTSHIISTTVVGSFANSGRSDDNRVSHIYPGLGSTLDQTAVYYYDTKKDILMTRAAHIDLWSLEEMSDAAILELWLILNFPPELSNKALENFPNSGFKQFCRGWALECYRRSTIGENVAIEKNTSKEKNYQRKILLDVPSICQEFLSCD